jgi:hypothetical protein
MALSSMPFQASAEVKSKVQIQIGKPSVWSLAQAHYLLAKMHKDNRNLTTRMPSEKDLDPNAINTTRIQLLRTLLDIEGQFNEKVGAENQSKQREEQFALRRRDEARAELAEKEDELDRVNADIRKLKRARARKQADFEQKEAERQAQAKPNETPAAPAPPPSKEQNELQAEIKELDVRIANKEAERKDLQEEIGIVQDQAGTPAAGTTGTTTTTANNAGSLRARANASVTPASLSEVTLGTGGALPDFNASLKDIITGAMKDAGKPTLAASIALDNFVGMQYEIIAKRLTLLRDEVGPDERIIFLELPSSIYTVPCKGDDYIAQVQWKVNWYYDDKQAEASMMDENIENHTNIEDVLNNRVELSKQLEMLKKRLIKLTGEQAEYEEKTARSTAKNKNGNRNDSLLDLGETVLSEEIKLVTQQIKSVNNELLAISRKVDEEKWKPAVTSNVRALDVIPRQSALNVNDVQATVSQKNFLGVLKLLLGLGIRVSYQRQRELYEQYLQQEVFASGFGKGSNAFGWTFGALPGTNRVAPGVRTTYAVLAVPRQASALRIEATGVAYHRKSAPDYVLDERRYDPKSKQILDNQHFIIRIPNEHTEQFKVMSVAYSAVKAGEAVTVVVKGDYFSPQIGVLVDGVALARSLSVGNTEISDAGLDNPATSGVRGQYELVSSREIVMKFSMGNEKYYGTPNITLVTPEKSTAINYLPLQVNYRYPRISLRALASFEPMFMEPFSLNKEFDASADGGAFLKARVTGTGLRSNAVISVNGRDIPVFKDRKWRLIAEETEKVKQEAETKQAYFKDLLYQLLKGQSEPGKGHVDQMIAEQLIRSERGEILDARTKMDAIMAEYAKRAPSEKNRFPDKGLIDKVLNNQAPFNNEDRRAIFMLFLDPPLEYPALQPVIAASAYQEALANAALEMYKNLDDENLRSELAHEILIYKFAAEYATRVCAKNGARGNECTEASKTKVMQRRLQELLSDNVDPFHQDEPYHNEELYQGIKEQLLEDWILIRKQVLHEAIAEKARALEARGQAHSTDNARDALLTEFAAKELKSFEKACEDDSNKERCELDKVKENLDADELLYQAIRAQKGLVTNFSLRPTADARKLPPLPGFDEVKARQNALRDIARLYEDPMPGEEYARQESTRAYTVRFLGNSSKDFNIRYRHKTSSGFEVAEFIKKGDPAFKIIRYIPNAGGNKALVDLRFYREEDKVDSITLFNPFTNTRIEKKPIYEADGKVRVSFEVKYQELGRGRFAEQDHIWIEVKPKVGKPGEKLANYEIELPVSARITRFANMRNGKPEGYADEQALITIYGYNLQTVARVLFGGKEATLVGKPDFNSVVLQAPKGDPVEKGEASNVSVVLLREDGSPVASPLFYTYLGPPSPVVIYRPRRGQQARRPRATEVDEEAAVDPEPDTYAGTETRPRTVRRRQN